MQQRRYMLKLNLNGRRLMMDSSGFITKSRFCEITGISQETLRYYVKNDVVKPVRDRNNNYQLYSLGDAARLIDIRMLRSLDYSVSEISDILDARNDYAAYRKWRDSTREKLVQEVASLQNKIALLDRQTDFFDSEQIYGPRIARFSEIYGVTADRDTSPGKKDLIKKLQEMLPLSNIMQRISRKSGERQLGFCVSGAGLNLLSSEELGLMERFGTTRILSYKRITDIDAMSADDFQDVFSYAEKHAYPIVSDLICIILFTFTENGKIGAGVIGGVVVEE